MSEVPRKHTVRLELTNHQRQQIREATGRDVNRIELRLGVLPEPAQPPAVEVEPTRGEATSHGAATAPDTLLP